MSERTQVKLKLTSDPEILHALERNNGLRTHSNGEKYFSAQFDAFEYRFFSGQELVVPATVAEGLYRASGVLIGDAMSGTQQPSLEIVEKWELGEQEPSRKASKTTCSICGEDQKTIKALVVHVLTHSEDKDEVEVEK